MNAPPKNRKNRAMTESKNAELKVTLREYIEALFFERDRLYDLRDESAKEALERARYETERRLDALNELRRAVESDRSQFVRQDVYDAKTKTYDNWCLTIDKTLTKIETRAMTWMMAIGALLTVIQLVLYYFVGTGHIASVPK